MSDNNSNNRNNDNQRRPGGGIFFLLFLLLIGFFVFTWIFRLFGSSGNSEISYTEFLTLKEKFEA